MRQGCMIVKQRRGSNVLMDFGRFGIVVGKLNHFELISGVEDHR